MNVHATSKKITAEAVRAMDARQQQQERSMAMNVPMYEREKERVMDEIIREKEQRWFEEALEREREKEAKMATSSKTYGNGLLPGNGLIQDAWRDMINNQGMGVAGLGRNLGQNMKPMKPVDPNDEPVMQMSLQDLHNLWAVRWGWDWVRVESIQDAGGMNWVRATKRLNAMLLVEIDVPSGMHKLVPKKWE